VYKQQFQFHPFIFDIIINITSIIIIINITRIITIINITSIIIVSSPAAVSSPSPACEYRFGRVDLA